MKRSMFSLLVLILITVGCTQNIASHSAGGAAAGAGGAMFVGALTDLIIDGKVDPRRLQRNAVSGGIVGGAGGAAVGYQKDKAEEKEEKLKQSNVTKSEATKLREQIGDDNFKGVKYLIACDHESAFRLTIQTVKSEKLNYRKAGVVLQALIDKDRGNEDGVNRSINQYLELAENTDLNTSTASKELGHLYSQLVDERKVKGISPTCSK